MFRVAIYSGSFLSNDCDKRTLPTKLQLFLQTILTFGKIFFFCKPCGEIKNLSATPNHNTLKIFGRTFI